MRGNGACGALAWYPVRARGAPGGLVPWEAGAAVWNVVCGQRPSLGAEARQRHNFRRARGVSRQCGEGEAASDAQISEPLAAPNDRYQR